MINHRPPLGTWRKSPYSLNENSYCVEVADFPQCIGVWDSKDHSVPALSFPVTSWSGFISAVKAGESAG
ncbi:DUF397 domain-containing protein [Streptomyces sp. YGL11-2]|uniref:DUF397 domain-containing protein n=1 Tax=Streptomyces sp. YGL11-2 TaxID=3414028 RepID=UPI003CE8297B